MSNLLWLDIQLSETDPVQDCVILDVVTGKSSSECMVQRAAWMTIMVNAVDDVRANARN